MRTAYSEIRSRDLGSYGKCYIDFQSRRSDTVILNSNSTAISHPQGGIGISMYTKVANPDPDSIHFSTTSLSGVHAPSGRETM